MIPQIVKNLFGTRNSRLLKKYRPLVDKINGLEEKYRSFKDIDFSTETERYWEGNPALLILCVCFNYTSTIFL